MEPDADEAPERVRILSTLAASRPPSKRASGRSRRKRGNSWQFKALLALMGLGIVGLLAGFAMVLAQGHSQTSLAVSPETGRTALVTAAPSASAADVPSAPAPQTALIEELPPAAVAGLGTAASPLAALPPPPPAASTTAKATAPAQAEPHRLAKAASVPSHAEARTRQTAAKRGQDADVALLEAMFTHTRAGGTDSERRRRCAQQPQSAGCTPSR